MTEKCRRYMTRAVLTVLTVAVALWIFSNSLRTATESSSQSSTVREWVQNFLNALFPGSEIEVSSHFIRKAAHFSEYALFGFLLFFTYLSYTRKKKLFFVPAIFAVLVPASDEGLQFFSEGRSPQFSDVGIDVCGAAFGMLCAWAAFFVVKTIVCRHRRKREERDARKGT